MKRVIILTIAMILTLNLSAQIKGVDFTKAKAFRTDADIENEVLLHVEDGNYAIIYPNTPVGVKHAIERFDKLLSDNDLKISDAIYKDVLLASYVRGLDDYGSLSTSLNVGDSEIVYGFNKNGYRIALSLKEDLRMIMFVKMK